MIAWFGKVEGKERFICNGCWLGVGIVLEGKKVQNRAPVARDGFGGERARSKEVLLSGGGCDKGVSRDGVSL